MKSIQVLRNLKLNISSLKLSSLKIYHCRCCTRSAAVGLFEDRGENATNGIDKLDQDESKPACGTDLYNPVLPLMSSYHDIPSRSACHLQTVLGMSEELGFGPQVKGNQRMVTRHFCPKNIYQPIPQLCARLFCASWCL